MNLLLPDTHLLLWTVATPARLSAKAKALIGDPARVVAFSTVSIWEIAIKANLGRADFPYDAEVIRRRLIEAGYCELPITGEHAIEAGALPLIHRDPFDRMLVGQARYENAVLLTIDRTLTRYPGDIRLVA